MYEYIVKYAAQVHMAKDARAMNECRIFYDKHSITFLLYIT